MDNSDFSLKKDAQYLVLVFLHLGFFLPPFFFFLFFFFMFSVCEDHFID